MDISKNELIVAAFKNGVVAGIDGIDPAERYIKTWISHVFIFDQVVYKISQTDNIEFNRGWRDIGNPVTRQWFYEEDFFWNQYFNGEVYQELLGVKVVGEAVSIVGKDENPDDLVIKMKRINADHNLTYALKQGELTEEDMRTVGFEMSRLIAEFPRKPQSEWSFYQYMESRLNDVLDFCYLAEKHLSRERAQEIMQPLYAYLKANKEVFEGMGQKEMVVGIDNHSDNVFCNQGHASFIDIYQVKDNWLLVAPELNIYRLNADVLVLGNVELSKALLQGYADYYPEWIPDERRGLFFTVYGAIIKGAYLQILDKPEEAEPYWQFVEGAIGEFDV